MPATYAHYRFGAQMLPAMPADMARAVTRCPSLFDVGLHGPDLFFYYSPLFPSRIRALGCGYHRQTGREFFSRVCRSLRPEGCEGAQAYLYGVLCHYALDAACHPYITERSRQLSVSHTRIETDFDRFLMEEDGHEPQRTDLSRHIRLSKKECEITARFYPEAQQRHIRSSVRSMAAIQRLLAAQTYPRRLLTQACRLGSREFGDMLHSPRPDPNCQQLRLPLLERYTQAAERFPQMLTQLGAHLTYNAPLGEEFDPSFG